MTAAKRHEGRRVLISGGTSGIGLAAARRFLEEGASVCLLGSNDRTVSDALTELEPLAVPGPLVGTACDVSREEEVAAAIELAATGLGGLDIAFINAGIDGEAKPALELDPGHLRRVLEVNVVGAFLVATGAARLMGREGRLIFNASVNAIRPEKLFADYNASKAAVASLAQTMALELADRGIVSLAICPGYVPTRMTAPYMEDPATAEELLADVPAGRFSSGEEVAGLVSFLAGEGGAYMTGSLVNIDGGRSI
ncbi:MAG: SDR family oxidoreductase [Solirubrobacterales bacterium]|nr:SDR family oxidoreductase [Solirubrobacterales bacterium]OJU93782.1 MAG: hypothetical protein BGO23_14295 [Solirubrobacterales bacterium 67-14]